VTNKERLREVANGHPTPGELTPERFEVEEFERVRETLYMAIVSEAIPRRLGAEASRGMLALDKRIARKIANMYRTLWASMDGEPPAWSSKAERLALAADAEQPVRRMGATVRWPTWIRETADASAIRRAQAAALALAVGRPRWGTRRVRLLTSEIDNLKRIAAEAIMVERRHGGRHQ
jgi:hypothetical protein